MIEGGEAAPRPITEDKTTLNNLRKSLSEQVIQPKNSTVDLPIATTKDSEFLDK